MVKKIANRLQPTSGFAHFFHLSIVALLPLAVFIFVRLELVGVALAVILLSKWRIFAIRPRYWLAHIRTNAVDIIFGLSILSFMTSTTSMSWQLLWVLAYEVWMLYIKPGTNALLVSVQALLVQMVGLLAVFIAFEEAGLGLYVALVALISYFSARHFFGSFEEHNYSAYSWTWALFSASLTWVLSHWLLFYGEVAQPALLLSVLAYGLGGLYYLSETDRLSKLVQRQLVFVVLAVVTLVLIFSDWGSSSL